MRVPSRVLYVRVPYYTGALKRDPSLENYPCNTCELYKTPRPRHQIVEELSGLRQKLLDSIPASIPGGSTGIAPRGVRLRAYIGFRVYIGFTVSDNGLGFRSQKLPALR